MFFSWDKTLRKKDLAQCGWGRIPTSRSFVRGSGRRSGIPRASPAVVRSGRYIAK